MCVCTYIYIRTYIHKYIHMYMYTYVNIYIMYTIVLEGKSVVSLWAESRGALCVTGGVQGWEWKQEAAVVRGGMALLARSALFSLLRARTRSASLELLLRAACGTRRYSSDSRPGEELSVRFLDGDDSGRLSTLSITAAWPPHTIHCSAFWLVGRGMWDELQGTHYCRTRTRRTPLMGVLQPDRLNDHWALSPWSTLQYLLHIPDIYWEFSGLKLALKMLFVMQCIFHLSASRSLPFCVFYHQPFNTTITIMHCANTWYSH